MPNWDFLLIGGLAVVIGAIVQSAVGIGLGLVAAPVVTLFFPSLMPGSLLIDAAVLPLLVLAREFRDADWRGLGWAFGGRLASTPLGVWFIALVPPEALGIAVGGVVLAAIGLSISSAPVRRCPATLIGAGVFAGAMGTATSIGGPPLALLYQRERGPRLRATLSIFFSIGAVISVLTLAAVNQLPAEQITAGVALIPFVLGGFAVSGPLRRYLDGGRIRGAVLAVTAASAIVLIVRSLV